MVFILDKVPSCEEWTASENCNSNLTCNWEGFPFLLSREDARPRELMEVAQR
jgi:hypothetical protein